MKRAVVRKSLDTLRIDLRICCLTLVRGTGMQQSRWDKVRRKFNEVFDTIAGTELSLFPSLKELQRIDDVMKDLHRNCIVVSSYEDPTALALFADPAWTLSSFISHPNVWNRVLKEWALTRERALQDEYRSLHLMWRHFADAFEMSRAGAIVEKHTTAGSDLINLGEASTLVQALCVFMMMTKSDDKQYVKLFMGAG